MRIRSRAAMPYSESMTTASCLVGVLCAVLACGCSSGSSDASAAGTGANVSGSPECTDFCAKTYNECGTSTKCDKCVVCAIPAGQCAASERAYLQCEVNAGTWTCGTTDSNWHVTNNCPLTPNLCEGDAG